MADKYKIKVVNDFLSVPEDKLELCLNEFKTAVLSAKAMAGLENAIGQLVGVKEIIFIPEFTWVDDDLHTITINFKDGITTEAAVPDSWKVSEEVHDIGWAVKQLKEGKKVRRPGWVNAYLAKNPVMADFECLWITYGGKLGTAEWQPSLDSLAATDWELYEEVQTNHT